MDWIVNKGDSKCEVENELFVVLSEAVYQRLCAYVDAVDTEISGMGEVVVKDGELVVTEVYLLEQVCTGAHTELDSTSIARLRAQLHEQGKAQDGFKLWWHSHANMGCFWSGTDTGTQEELVSDTDWALSIVLNKKREIRAKVSVRDKVVGTIGIDELPVIVRSTSPEFDGEGLKKEVEEKVKDKVVTGFQVDRSAYPYSQEGYHLDPNDDVPSINSSVHDEVWDKLGKKKRKIVRKYFDLTAPEEPTCTMTVCRHCKFHTVCFWHDEPIFMNETICFECLKGKVLEARKEAGHGQ